MKITYKKDSTNYCSEIHLSRKSQREETMRDTWHASSDLDPTGEACVKGRERDEDGI